jgi:hypothetical protein
MRMEGAAAAVEQHITSAAACPRITAFTLKGRCSPLVGPCRALSLARRHKSRWEGGAAG